MRRTDREVTGTEALCAILDRCRVCRLGMLDDDGLPYIVPMNFGYAREGEALTLYFHCAPAGKKLALLRRDPRVSFELDGGHALVDHAQGCSISFRYESVMGRGSAALLEGPEQKRAALDIILRHQTERTGFAYPEAALAAVAVIAVRVEAMTGKRH